MFGFGYMPCAECGESVARRDEDTHVCDPNRRVDYLMFQLRDDVARFTEEFMVWLGSREGEFHTWLAARDVREN